MKARQTQPMPAPAPQAALPPPPPPHVNPQALTPADVFGAAPQDQQLGLMAGMYNMFKGPNAGQTFMPMAHHQEGFRAPIHESMVDFGTDGSFIDKLPGNSKRVALANAVGASRPGAEGSDERARLDKIRRDREYEREFNAG